MQTAVQIAMAPGAAGGDPAGGAQRGAGLHLEIQATGSTSGDAGNFKAMFDHYLRGDAMKVKPDTHSLGSAVAQRAIHLAADVKQDQLYVSRLLETATRSGDSMQLMKAMMALNDYQLRVQTISKTVSKAVSSIDSLTKLQ